VIVRVALVLLLLAVATLGLSGRRELDWAAISDSPESSWIGLLLVGAATFVVVASFHALARMLRTSQESDDDEPEASLEGSRVTWYGYLAAAAVIALTIFGVYLLVRSAVDVPTAFRDPGKVRNDGPPTNGDGNAALADGWSLLAVVLVGAALGVAFLLLRRHAVLAEEPDDDAAEPDERAALAEAVAAAEEELDSHGDDTRAAIIAAYLAMEGQLVASGTNRSVSDTPTEFLLRAVAASQVSRGAATRLTELFREARFSTHPMASTARADAVRALARVSDDLAQAGSRG
jgi:hypothetical protein